MEETGDTYKQLAQIVAAQGRGGDKKLLHVSDDELDVLRSTGLLTKNPSTDLYEAFKLKNFLKFALPVAAAFFGPEVLAGLGGGAAAGGDAVTAGLMSGLGDTTADITAGLAAGGGGTAAGAGGGFIDALGGGGAGGGGAFGGEAAAGATPGLAGSFGAPVPSISPQLQSLAASPGGGEAIQPATAFGAPATSTTPAVSAGLPAAGAGAGAAPVEDAVINAVPQGSAVPGTIGEDLKVAAKTAEPASWLQRGAQSLGLTNKEGNLNLGTALTGAGLGASALQQSHLNKQMGNAQKEIAGVTAPLKDAQQHLMAQYNSGQLNASDAQHIHDWEQGQVAQVKQYYAKAGLADSDMAQKAIGDVTAKAEAMRQQALQNYLSQAITTTGAVTAPLSGIANQQIAQDQGLQQAFGKTFQALGQQQSNPQ